MGHASQNQTAKYDRRPEHARRAAVKKLFVPEVLPIRTVLSEYYDRMGELAGRCDEDIFGVPTGFIDLDRMLGGLQNSDLLILAGRPGTGKTACC